MGKALRDKIGKFSNLAFIEQQDIIRFICEEFEQFFENEIILDDFIFNKARKVSESNTSYSQMEVKNHKIKFRFGTEIGFVDSDNISSRFYIQRIGSFRIGSGIPFIHHISIFSDSFPIADWFENFKKYKTETLFFLNTGIIYSQGFVKSIRVSNYETFFGFL